MRNVYISYGSVSIKILSVAVKDKAFPWAAGCFS